MKSILYIIVSSFLFVQFCNAQQYVDFLNIRNDMVVANPAAPSEGYLNYGNTTTISASYKNQWLNFDESPKTYGLQFRQISELLNLNYGLTLLSDQTGAISNLNILANVSYQIFLDRKNRKIFAAGFTGGVNQYSINTDEINFQQNPNLMSSELSRLGGEIGFGLFLADVRKFYFGISAPQFINSYGSALNQLRIDKRSHFFSQMGLYFNTNDFKIEPHANFSYQSNAPLNYMFGVDIMHENGFLAGLGFNSANTPIVHLGYAFRPYDDGMPFWTASISYGDRFNTYRNILGGSLELNLAYSIGGAKSKLDCPKF